MRVSLAIAPVLFLVVSVAACAAATPAVPVPPTQASDTPVAVFTAQATTTPLTANTAVVGTIVSTPFASNTATVAPPTAVPPSSTPTVIASPSPVPAQPTPSASPEASQPPPIPSATEAAPVSIPANGPLTVTLADEGKTVTLKAGSSFLLSLGEDFDWQVTIADQSIVSRQINIAVIRGAQGVYNAHKAGRTTLTAVGGPACLTSTPPCKAPSRMVEITLVVT
jgi:hypothetical protein